MTCYKREWARKHKSQTEKKHHNVPEFLEIVDMTYLGLDITTERIGKTVRILISCGLKDINTMKQDLKAIKSMI